MLELAKTLTRVEERSESQSIDEDVKDPNPSQWGRGPVSLTAMLVNQFFKDYTQLRPRGWKGGSYRQSALIPTCGAPDSIVH